MYTPNKHSTEGFQRGTGLCCFHRLITRGWKISQGNDVVSQLCSGKFPPVFWKTLLVWARPRTWEFPWRHPQTLQEKNQYSATRVSTRRWAPFLEPRLAIPPRVRPSSLPEGNSLASFSLISQHFVCTLFIALNMLHCNDSFSYLSQLLEGEDKKENVLFFSIHLTV